MPAEPRKADRLRQDEQRRRDQGPRMHAVIGGEGGEHCRRAAGRPGSASSGTARPQPRAMASRARKRILGRPGATRPMRICSPIGGPPSNRSRSSWSGCERLRRAFSAHGRRKRRKSGSPGVPSPVREEHHGARLPAGRGRRNANGLLWRAAGIFRRRIVISLERNMLTSLFRTGGEPVGIAVCIEAAAA